MSQLQREFRPPDDLTGLWSLKCDVPATSIDELDHVTAAFYPRVFEDAAFEFIKSLLRRESADYVVGQMHLLYRREVLLTNAPVTVYVALDDVTDSSWDLSMVLVDLDGATCTVAANHYVAWDRERRCRRLLTTDEASALGDYLGA
jgi:acyl-CoA thioesterase FadM